MEKQIEELYELVFALAKIVELQSKGYKTEAEMILLASLAKKFK